MKYATDANWVIDLFRGDPRAIALQPTLLADGLAFSAEYRDGREERELVVRTTPANPARGRRVGGLVGDRALLHSR